MHVYFIRHGETDFNLQGIIQGRGVDSDLNDTGRQQARAFFEAYQHIDFELIVTSTLKRTHQTVSHFLERDIPWIQMPELDEISWGSFEGTAPSIERYEAFQHILRAWRNGDLDAALPEGESARQLDERLTRFVEWLKTRNEKHILVATHRVLISRLKQLPVSEMDQVGHTNTGCYMAHFTDEGVRFHLENDLSHL
jgi:probable phosphoglycerate mutase